MIVSWAFLTIMTCLYQKCEFSLLPGVCFMHVSFSVLVITTTSRWDCLVSFTFSFNQQAIEQVYLISVNHCEPAVLGTAVLSVVGTALSLLFSSACVCLLHIFIIALYDLAFRVPRIALLSHAIVTKLWRGAWFVQVHCLADLVFLGIRGLSDYLQVKLGKLTAKELTWKLLITLFNNSPTLQGWSIFSFPPWLDFFWVIWATFADFLLKIRFLLMCWMK